MPKKINTEAKVTKNEKKVSKIAYDKSKFAVIELGAKQYFVREGETIEVELIKDGAKIIKLKDLVNKKEVTLSVVNEIKGKKISIWKFKNKTRYLKRMGHRQKYLLLKVDKIS